MDVGSSVLTEEPSMRLLSVSYLSWTQSGTTHCNGGALYIIYINLLPWAQIGCKDVGGIEDEILML